MRWMVAIVVILVFACDILSKQAVEQYFLNSPTPRAPIMLCSNFFGIDVAISPAINTGAAWGLFASYPKLLAFCRILFIVGLGVYLYYEKPHPSWYFPLALIITGAIANVIDFFLYGHVIDMLAVTFWGYHYPIFNLADSAIFVGTMAILWMSLLQKSPST